MSAIKARGKRVRLWEAPIGLFYCGDTLCLKTEYRNNEGRIDAYIVESGEFFWGGAKSDLEQREILVTPAIVSTASQATTPANPFLEQMAEALEPFADQAETFEIDGKKLVPDQFEPAIVGHTVGDLRRARSVLDAYKASKESEPE